MQNSKQIISVDEFRAMNRKLVAESKQPKGMRIPKPSPEKQFIDFVLKACGVPYEREYRFAPDRKFLADWALPDRKILIEYEGLVWNSKQSTTGKSRHTSVAGFTMDCEKYNLATKLGFKILRYTAKNYKDVDNDLSALLLFNVK